jgi:RimJ/RimL family protein N-acetyltransferase
MLEGRLVNLRCVEKEDVDFLVGLDDIDFWAEYNNPPFARMSKSEWMKWFDTPFSNYLANLIDCRHKFIILKKDGTKIGFTWHFTNQPYGHMEIACFLAPSERGKGYGTEAVQLMVDNLFIYRNIARIQATANVGNKAAQRVLEKAGFKVEGTIRKLSFVRGEWTDRILYSILLEEWKEPRILTKTR